MKAIVLFTAALLSTAAAQNYEQRIAPILRTYCAGCHNDTDLEGDFSMETFAALRKGGEKGDPLKAGETGPLLLRVIEQAGKLKMPPKDEPQLPPGELATLKSWIAAGAPGPANDVSLFKSLTVPKTAPVAGSKRPVTAAAYSADGRMLAIAQGGAVEIRHAADGAVLHRLTGFPGKVNAVHFSPDGAHLLAATGIVGLSGTAQLWSTADGKIVREFAAARDTLYDAEFSPDGALVATAGYDRIIRLWQTADAKLVRSIDVHKGAIFDLAFDPSGRVLASASADATVKLWRVADGERLDTLNQPLGEQTAVLFTPDGGHIVSAGADKRIHIWRFVSREKPALNPLLLARFAHDSAVCGLALAADGKSLLSSADDRTLKVWSLPALIERHAWPAQPAAAPVLAPQPASERFLVARMNGTTESLVIPPVKPIAAVPVAAETIVPAAAAVAVETNETEPNNTPAQAATAFPFPAKIKGTLGTPGDTDCFRFHASAGQELVLDVDAASAGSKIDSRIEILTPDGQPVEQVVLQAVKDSWLTFRGKDSVDSDDFRLQNWREMELNDWLYCNGEVVKLWRYPRGPDSGFRVYPGNGSRHTYFQTTANAHPLGEFCYLVQPLAPGSQPPPNGLPVFRIHYENDDEPNRRSGSDSLLIFKAPRDGDYIARLTDVRGFGGEKDHHYTLTLRAPQPSFTASVGGKDPKVSPGGGREISIGIVRSEGLDGPVRVDFANLPPGFTVTTPIVIEPGQSNALGVLRAAPDAAAPDEAASKAVKITATTTVGGKEITQDLGDLGKILLAEKPKLTVEILPAAGDAEAGKPVEFTIHPGETITARVRVARHDFKARIAFGTDDCGRNLPHGVFVDNIGLNGLLIVEGQTEREFSITAAPIAQPGERLFHLKAAEDGSQVSPPALLRVVR